LQMFPTLGDFLLWQRGELITTSWAWLCLL